MENFYEFIFKKIFGMAQIENINGDNNNKNIK